MFGAQLFQLRKKLVAHHRKRKKYTYSYCVIFLFSLFLFFGASEVSNVSRSRRRLLQEFSDSDNSSLLPQEITPALGVIPEPESIQSKDTALLSELEPNDHPDSVEILPDAKNSSAGKDDYREEYEISLGSAADNVTVVGSLQGEQADGRALTSSNLTSLAGDETSKNSTVDSEAFLEDYEISWGGASKNVTIVGTLEEQKSSDSASESPTEILDGGSAKIKSEAPILGSSELTVSQTGHTPTSKLSEPSLGAWSIISSNPSASNLGARSSVSGSPTVGPVKPLVKGNGESKPIVGLKGESEEEKSYNLLLNEDAIFLDEGLETRVESMNGTGDIINTDNVTSIPLVDPFAMYRNLSEYFILEENFESILWNVSNKKREFILSTFMIPVVNETRDDDFEYGMTAFNVNWAFHLNSVGVTRFLLIGMDDESCVPTRAKGIPCYVNTFDWLQNETIIRGPQVALKWLFLYKAIKMGFHPIFLDNDAVVVQNPFLIWDRKYDVQALSDTRPADGILPRLAVNFNCGVSKLYENVHYPCVSTGVMFYRARMPTLIFLRALVEKISEYPGKVWEQALFQKLVLPFTIQVSSELRALKFRVLPLESYHNVGVLEVRNKNNLNSSTIIVHCGYVYGSQAKRRALKKNNFWHDQGS